MARPLKQGVDYFPLDVKLDDKFELIEAVHGIVGFGVAIKLYQRIYASSYYLNVTEKEVLVISKRVNVDINLINEIISECVRWGIFNKILYEKYSILTSKGIQKRYFEIVGRRKKVVIDERFLLIDHGLSNEIIELVNADINPVNVDGGTQSKVNRKETKEKLKETNAKKRQSGYSKEFEYWWKDYPVIGIAGKGAKGKAFDNYRKLSVEDQLKLPEYTENYRLRVTKFNSKTKHAERFLKDDFWKDYDQSTIKKAVDKNLKSKSEVGVILRAAISRENEEAMWDHIKQNDLELYKAAKNNCSMLFRNKELDFSTIWAFYNKG